METDHTDKEIEVRFLEVDAEALKAKLRSLGAQDLGEDTLQEMIFQDPDGEWKKHAKLVRVRKTKDQVLAAFKHHQASAVDGAQEVEFHSSDAKQTKKFMEAIGLQLNREQHKRRHSFRLGNVTIDFDTWPNIPTYVELEGASEKELREVAEQLGLEWDSVTTQNAALVIESYGIPVRELKTYTFDKME